MSKENIECLEAWLNHRKPKPPNKYQRKAIRKRNEQIELILKQQQQQNEKH